MDREEIAKKVIELAAEEAGMGRADVSPESHFVDDLKYDSLATVEFAMALEEEFAISIPDADVEKLQMVGAVIEYVVKRTKDAPVGTK